MPSSMALPYTIIELSSKLLEKLLSPAFRHIADNFVDGFIKRAENIYG